MNNCLEIGQIGSQFNLIEVDDYINRFLLNNFAKIPDLCKLPFERLKYLLGSNDLEGKNKNFSYFKNQNFLGVREIELFYNAKTWLEGGDGTDSRMDRAGELMEQIKFPLIQPSSDLNEIKDVDFMKTSTCMKLLLEGNFISHVREIFRRLKFIVSVRFFTRKLMKLSSFFGI